MSCGDYFLGHLPAVCTAFSTLCNCTVYINNATRDVWVSYVYGRWHIPFVKQNCHCKLIYYWPQALNCGHNCCNAALSYNCL